MHLFFLAALAAPAVLHPVDPPRFFEFDGEGLLGDIVPDNEEYGPFDWSLDRGHELEHSTEYDIRHELKRLKLELDSLRSTVNWLDPNGTELWEDSPMGREIDILCELVNRFKESADFSDQAMPTIDKQLYSCTLPLRVMSNRVRHAVYDSLFDFLWPSGVSQPKYHQR